MSDPRREKLVGAWITLPTFNDDNYNLLLDRSRIHIRWLIDNGITEGNAVLLIAGGNGEGTFMDEGEWRSLAEVLAETADGRVPTAVGVSELSARAAAKKAKFAADIGIDYIQIAPPHYMTPTDDDVYGYYKYVNDHADVGMVAYNLPWCIPGGYEFTQPTFERLATLENVVGIKWGSLSVAHWAQMIRLFKHRFNFIEQGGILSVGYRLGIVGFTDGVGAVAPRLSLHKARLLREGCFEEIDEMEIARLDAAIDTPRLSDGAYQGMGEGFTREELRVLGMEPGPVFPYQTPPTDAFIQNKHRMAEALGLQQWVDWDQSLFDEARVEAEAATASAD